MRFAYKRAKPAQNTGEPGEGRILPSPGLLVEAVKLLARSALEQGLEGAL